MTTEQQPATPAEYPEFHELTPEQARLYLQEWPADPMHPLIRLWVAESGAVEPVRSVLDLGCGPGTDALCFAPPGYLGIDFSRQLISVARERHPAHTFAGADGRALPFEAESFDLVLLKYTINTCASLDDALNLVREALRVARRSVFLAYYAAFLPAGEAPQVEHRAGRFGLGGSVGRFPVDPFWRAFQAAGVVDAHQLDAAPIDPTPGRGRYSIARKRP